MDVRILNRDQVRQSLTMKRAISSVSDAYAQFSTGLAKVPLRERLDIPAVGGTTLIMPAYLPSTQQLAVKIVSVHPENNQKLLPTIHALVMVIDPLTGIPVAIMDGGTLTAIRTGAGSGAATEQLARSDSRVATIIGSGVQARTQLEAICTVRDFDRVLIYSMDQPGAEAFMEESLRQPWAPPSIQVVNSPSDAIPESDVICAATTSSTPVFSGDDLKPGAHVNAIGSFTPEMQELDLTTLQRSQVFVDSRSAVLAESGDLMIPIQSGELGEEIIRAEIGEVIAGKAVGRSSTDEITVFKSVGLAVQDVAAANAALQSASAENIGTVLSL